MALKTIIAAGLVAFTMSLLPGPAAEAKTTVNVAIGNGGWVGNCWDRNGRRCGWRAGPRHFHYAPRHRPGVYLYYTPRHRPGAYYDFSYGYVRPYRAPLRARMTCAAARNMVDHNGFNSVRTRECRGDVYTFKARRHGRNFIVKVNAHSRRIIGVGGI